MPLGAHPPFRVLIVSTQHAGCSLVAERLLRPALAAQGFERHAIRVTSAGLTPGSDEPLPEVVVDTVASLGGSVGGFKPHLLDAETATDADVILTMSVPERDRIMQDYPRMIRHTFTLDEYLRLAEKADVVAPLAEQPLALALYRESTGGVIPENLLPAQRDNPDSVVQTATRLARLVTELVTLWVPIAPADARIVPQYIPAETVVTVRLNALETAVDVECSGQGGTALARALMAAWRRCVRRVGIGDATLNVVIHDDPAELAEARSRGHLAYANVAEAMHALSSLITVRAIDARAGELIMIHAAGLALPDGRVVAFAAPSGTGKTTLCRTLGRRYGYVTDETLAVRRDGSIVPYPKPLSVVQEGSRIKAQVAPDDAGLYDVPDTALRLAGLVMLHRVEGTREPLVEEYPLLDGIVELAPQLSYLGHLDEPLQTLAQVIESVGGLHRLTYSDVDAVAGLVERLAVPERAA